MPTIHKQQEYEGSTEEGESDGTTNDDIGEVLASMSRADALRLLPTAMKDGQTSTLAAPAQSVVPDPEANDITAGSHTNVASRCAILPSTIPFLIVSLVILYTEIAGRFVF
jgi:hypothetical protein